MDLEFAKQGLGFLIAAIEAGVIVILFRNLNTKEKTIEDLQEKRIADAKLYTESFVGVAKEMVATQKDQAASTTVMQKSLDSVTQILQDLLQNIRKI